MASLAELMFQSASKSISDFKPGENFVQGMQAGAQMARAKEANEMRRQQLENMQTLTAAKRDGIWLDKIAKASKLENTKMRNLLYENIGKEAEAAGNPFDPSFIPGLKSSTASATAISQAQSDYQAAWNDSMKSGGPTPQLTAAREQLANMMYGGNLEPLVKAEQQFERAQLVQEGQMTRTGQQIMERQRAQQAEFEQFPVKERQKKVIAYHTAFTKEGGLSKINANLDKGREALKKLEDGKIKTGTGKLKVLLNLPFIDQMNMLRTVDPELALVADELQSAINVKKALDSQFSDVMAVRVFSRIFDPLAPNKLNAERVRKFIEETEAEKDARISSFKEFNLSTGEEPKNSKATDKAPDEIDIPEAQVMQLRDAYNKLITDGKSPEEVFNMLKQGVGGTDAQINALIKKFQIEGK